MGGIVFYLMNQKGYRVLRAFLEKYDVSFLNYVVLSKDHNVKNDYFIETKALCEKYEIKYYIRTDILPEFRGYKLAVGWRWLISNSDRLIILHDSLLPKYRGFSPLVNMLINGEEEIGVTALFASEEYDRGDIIKKEKIPIQYPIKIEEAINKISNLYVNLVLFICETLFNGNELPAHSQDENKASYSLWRDEEDYLIDWHENSTTIKRSIDALSYPFNGAKSYLNEQLVTVLNAEVLEDRRIENRDVGKVIFIEDGSPVIVCGKGLIKVTEVFDSNNNTLLPLKKFRTRFEGRK